MKLNWQYLKHSYLRVIFTLLIIFGIFTSSIRYYPTSEWLNLSAKNIDSKSDINFITTSSEFHGKNQLSAYPSDGQENKNEREENDTLKIQYYHFEKWESIPSKDYLLSSGLFSFCTKKLNNTRTPLYILFHSWIHFF